MVIVKVKKLGNWALQIYAGEIIIPRKVVFLAVLFITDDAQMVSWLVLLPCYPRTVVRIMVQGFIHLLRS